MSLKQKIILSLSIAFSLLLGTGMLIIYFSFSNFRKDEFKERFRQRLLFTSRFIAQSKNFETDAPIFFSEDNDNILLNEQILIFNEQKKLIYSSIKDKNVIWDTNLLNKLDKNSIIYTQEPKIEIYAAKEKIKGEFYYIITSAKDVNGASKLNFLKYLLMVSYVVSMFMIVFLSYYLLTKFLTPLERLNKEVSKINVSNLTTPLPIRNSHDEIDVLTQSFNLMMSRLNDVFQSQKSFTASASHEIRTPLTRMSFQVENLIEQEKYSPETIMALKKIQQNIFQLSDLTNSLLLLTKFDKENFKNIIEEVRIDEVIFSAYDRIKTNFPELKMDFQISEKSVKDASLNINGVKSLLEIVFGNLFKNAVLYAQDKKVKVLLEETEFSIYVKVITLGKAISQEEQKNLFQPFMRGENSREISGSGLGLHIIKRILDYHYAEIRYSTEENFQNQFKIRFRK